MGSTSVVEVYNRLKKIRDGIDKVLEHIVVIMMAFLVATVAFQVFYRFVIVKFYTKFDPILILARNLLVKYFNKNWLDDDEDFIFIDNMIYYIYSNRKEE